MSQPENSPLVAQALAQIERKVAERRARGEYPAGLEEQLDRWFQEFLRNAHDAQSSNLDALQARLSDLNRWPGFDAGRIEYTSRNRVAATVHKAAAATVRRQTQGILAQNQEFADQVRTTLNEVGEAVSDIARGHDTGALAATLSGILDRLAIVDQLVVRVGELERRLMEVDSHDAVS